MGGHVSITNKAVDKTVTITTQGTKQALDVNVAGGTGIFTPSSVLAGQDASVTTSAATLPDITGKGFLIQADPTNTDTILLGDSSNQYLKLGPGDVVPIHISNTNLIYAKSASGTQTVNIFGVS